MTLQPSELSEAHPLPTSIGHGLGLARYANEERHVTDPSKKPAYEATAAHCELLRAKITRLTDALAEATEQLYTSADREYRAGNVGMDDLVDLYGRARTFTIKGVGFTGAWNANMSVRIGQIQHYIRTPPAVPNGPGGNHWEGPHPLAGAPRPRHGEAVVYVLYGPTNEPVYLGSTADFTARIGNHRRDGKEFIWWIAYPCESREAAYLLEVGLLGARRPALNKKVGR